MADNGLFGKSFHHPSGASNNAFYNGSGSLAASTSAANRLASSSSLAESPLAASFNSLKRRRCGSLFMMAMSADVSITIRPEDRVRHNP